MQWINAIIGFLTALFALPEFLELLGLFGAA